MIKDAKAFSSFSVKDLSETKKFYSETLGLSVSERPEGLELQLGGAGHVFIYPSSTNKPADFTILNFIVDDIEKAVDEFLAKGIHMEQYDMPQLKTDAKGIARGPSGPEAIAWFKDPSGNILSVMQE